MVNTTQDFTTKIFILCKALCYQCMRMCVHCQVYQHQTFVFLLLLAFQMTLSQTPFQDCRSLVQGHETFAES